MKGVKSNAKLILPLLSIIDQCKVIVKVSLGLFIEEIQIIREHDYGSKVRILDKIVKMDTHLLSVGYKNKILNRRFNL
jgi:hypothetical protein